MPRMSTLIGSFTPHGPVGATVALFAAAAMLAVPACKPKEAPEASVKEVALPPIAVDTAKVEIRAMPRFLTLTGSIGAERQSEVAANVSGRIISTYVERGQPGKEGQTLAIVDSRAAGYSASAAAAQSKAAETQLAQAQEDCSRSERLYAQGALSKA